MNDNLGSYNAAREREANVIGQKINAARKARGISLKALAEQLKGSGVELNMAAVNKWETGVTVPNIYQFLAVHSLLGMDGDLTGYRADCPPELNAEGLRKLDEYRRDLIASGNYAPKVTPMPKLMEMPVAYIAAAAGTGNFLDENDAFDWMSFPAEQIPEGADVGIRVSGDSMEPMYHDGDIVWVQKCDGLNPGEVGIFILDGQAYLKMYGEREPGEDFREELTDSYGVLHAQPVLYSINAAKYAPIAISPYSTFRIFGRVLG